MKLSETDRQRRREQMTRMNLENNPNKDQWGCKNPSWKGDDVSYSGLHLWINDHMPRPKFCEICNIKRPEEAANITGIYNRDFANWKFLCRRCHMGTEARWGNAFCDMCSKEFVKTSPNSRRCSKECIRAFNNEYARMFRRKNKS